MRVRTERTRYYVADILCFILGTLLYCTAVSLFILPAGILPGGVTGIAAAVTHYIGAGTGTLTFVLNIPILYLGFKKMGFPLVIKTSVVTLLISAALNVFEEIDFSFEGDRMLSSLAGGALMGAGIGIIMLRGATTGGTDIIAKLVNNRLPSLTVGRVTIISDVLVVSLSAFVYKDISSALYSLICMYAAASVTDIILYGSGGGKAVYAVCEDGDAVCRDISSTLRRGVTKLTAAGGYTGRKKTMVFCVCRKDEINRVINVIKDADPAAFITVCDAGDIIGEGFTPRR